MATEILMPALSPTMTEGNLSRWIKKEGDSVSPGDIIAEIETDKATMEVECIDEGVLGKIVVPEGTPDVKVNQLIAVLVSEGEGKEEVNAIIEAHDASFVQKKLNNHPTQQIKEQNQAMTSPTADRQAEIVEKRDRQIQARAVSEVTSFGTLADSKIKVSPLAKRMAVEKRIELAGIEGSGPYGRIIKRDIENYTQSAKDVSSKFSTGNIVYTQDSHRENQVIPLTQMRKVIAKRLLEAKQNIPHFYITSECRIDELMKIRKEMNAEFAESGVKISVNDMIMKAASYALRDVPEANSAWNEDSIIQFGNIDISVAVATNDGGLITPIVFSADKKGLVELSQNVKQLVLKANANQLAPHEFQGGSFSISNLGMYDVDEFKAIINPPQSCILAIGKAYKKPVVSESGEIEIGTILKLSLSCDHRVVDGRIGAILLKQIKLYLEKPYMLLK